MSDWELVQDKEGDNSPPQSDWELSPTPISQKPQSNEGLGMAAIKAPFRIKEDLYRGGMNFLKSIPGYYEAAKTQIPGAYETLKAHPGHAAMQALAGTQEGINMLAQMPKNLAQYASQRLNLLPESAVNAIGKFGPEDTTQAIQQLFGSPQYAGEDLIRGVGRNVFNVAGGLKAASALNPMRLTQSGITKNVLKEGDRQIAVHSKMYDKLWDDASKAGIGNVPVNNGLISQNIDFIKKYKSPREYKTLETFNANPSLPNAQKAVSDVRGMMRGLDEKSRTTSLTGEEKHLYDSLSNTESHIEQNMFKHPSGHVNQGLADRYKSITNSYRENVVPYRYNSAIQAYKNKEITKKELVNSLSKGEFAAKKGSKHPAIGIRNNLLPILGGVGALDLGGRAYGTAFGNSGQE